MKQSMRYIMMISFIAAFFITGCSKQPLQEMNAARSAVDSVISEGAEKYLPDDAKKINDALNKAMDEVKAQDGKLFKNYDKAKEMLAAVKKETEAINGRLAAQKEEVKKDALTAIEDAKTALNATKELFEKASSRKGSKAPDPTIEAELKNLESSFKELQVQVEREDYLNAIFRSGEIETKSLELSALLKQTSVKTEKKKK